MGQSCNKRKLERLAKAFAHSIEDEVEKGEPSLNASRAHNHNRGGKAVRHNGRKVDGREKEKRGLSTSMLSYIRSEFTNETLTKESAPSSGQESVLVSEADPSVRRIIVDDPESVAHIDVKELETIMKALEDKDHDLKQELQEQRKLLKQAIQSLNSMNAQIEEIEEQTPEERQTSHSLPVTSKSCEIVHPGAECCTRTMISISPAENRGTVTIQASVQPYQASNSAEQDLNTQDMVALASLAIEKAGRKLFAHETHTLRKKKRDSGRHAKHLELLNILQHGKIVSSRRSDHNSEFGHESFLVELEDQHSKRRINAIFKPKSEEGESSGWHRVEIERVAYQLNLLLGMDYLPPSAVRKGAILVDGREFDEGCFTYFVNGATQLNEVDPGLWRASKEVFLSDTRILDVLLHNSDRHQGHFLYGKHWIEGPSTYSNGRDHRTNMCTFLIDHAAGFRREACVRMDHENAFMTGPTRIVSARTYLHLRYLTYDILEAKLSPHLNSSEICVLNRRKDAILDYFDGLVFFNGYDGVVID